MVRDTSLCCLKQCPKDCKSHRAWQLTLANVLRYERRQNRAHIEDLVNALVRLGVRDIAKEWKVLELGCYISGRLQENSGIPHASQENLGFPGFSQSATERSPEGSQPCFPDSPRRRPDAPQPELGNSFHAAQVLAQLPTPSNQPSWDVRIDQTHRANQEANVLQLQTTNNSAKWRDTVMNPQEALPCSQFHHATQTIAPDFQCGKGNMISYRLRNALTYQCQIPPPCLFYFCYILLVASKSKSAFSFVDSFHRNDGTTAATCTTLLCLTLVSISNVLIFSQPRQPSSTLSSSVSGIA